jgi:hypothetical protein
MSPAAYSVPLFAIALSLAILAMLTLGRAIAKKRLAADPSAGIEGFGAVEGVVFGLLGLLIAFEFSGAASRFDKRRDLILQEANAIGTAYLRIDLLPPTYQVLLRPDFRRYIDSRLAIYKALPDVSEARKRLSESATVQTKIWREAVAGCKISEQNGNAVTSLVLSAINDMIDITTTRTAAMETHPPLAIFIMLTAMILAAALLAGHAMAKVRYSWVHLAAFTLLLPICIYVIFDIEFPRAGLIRVNTFDQLLIDVRSSMN